MNRENNALPYNTEYDPLIVLQILCLLLEVRPKFFEKYRGVKIEV